MKKTFLLIVVSLLTIIGASKGYDLPRPHSSFKVTDCNEGDGHTPDQKN